MAKVNDITDNLLSVLLPQQTVVNEEWKTDWEVWHKEAKEYIDKFAHLDKKYNSRCSLTINQWKQMELEAPL